MKAVSTTLGAVSIDLDAEIVPDDGLGGLRLRTRLCDLQDLLNGLGQTRRGSYELVTPFEARYRLLDGEIEAAVDFRNGKIFKLIACSGYRGRLFGRIAVGMPVREAMLLEPRLYYSEPEELILCRGVEGLAIDVPETDPPPDLVPDLAIEAISVYAREVSTAAGAEGRW